MKNLPWLAANLPGYFRFRRALADPERSQRVLLRRYLQENAATAFGRAHGFSTIRTAEEYRERVPLAHWEDVAPWVDRIAAGEPEILTRSPVRTLEPTSGSSAARKLIPYTAELQREIRRAVAPWIVDLYARRPQLIPGTAYWSITPVALEEERPAGPVPVGSRRTPNIWGDSGAGSSMRPWLFPERCATSARWRPSGTRPSSSW